MNFYVGQRVRIVACVSVPALVGAETLITEPEQAHWSPVEGGWMGYGVAINPNFKPSGDALRPEVPEGMESLADTLALWQPEQVAA